MLDVIVALLPALGMAVYLFGPRVLALTLVSVAACVGAEYGYRRLMGLSNTVGDLSACVTGLLLAMSLPVTAPYWAPVLGGVFAIVVVKQFYGGLGRNFMNPALAGRALLCTFPGLMTTWVDTFQKTPLFGQVDAVSSPHSNGPAPRWEAARSDPEPDDAGAARGRDGRRAGVHASAGQGYTWWGGV